MTKSWVGWWKRQNLFVLAAVLLVLAAGYAQFGAHIGAEDFDPDEYNEMTGITGSLGDYFQVRPGRPLAHFIYWACYRAGHGSLAVLRLPSMLAGLAHITLVLLLCLALWPNRKIVPLFVGCYVVFSHLGIRYCRWGCSNFGFYVLFSSLLFFLFVALSRRSISRRDNYWIVGICLILPWVYITTLIGFTVGVFLLFLMKVMEQSGSKLRAVWHAAWELKFFALGFANFALSSRFELYQTAGLRLNMYPYYFPLSDLPKTFAGAVTYGSERVTTLYLTLAAQRTLLPGLRLGSHVVNTNTLLVYGCIALLLLFMVRPLLRLRRNENGTYSFGACDSDHFFISGYIILCTAGIYVLGLLGKYPFGDARWAFYLTTPVFVAAALELSDLAGFLVVRPFCRLGGLTLSPAFAQGAGRWLTRLALAGFLAAFVLGPGQRLVGVVRDRARTRAMNDAIIRTVRDTTADVVLVDSNVTFWIRQLAPAVMARAHVMGFAVDSRKTSPSSELLGRMKSTDQPVRTVLAVTFGNKGDWTRYTAQDYPGFAPLFTDRDFTMVDSLGSGRICATQLVRRGMPPPVTDAPRSATASAVAAPAVTPAPASPQSPAAQALPTLVGISAATLDGDGRLAVRGWAISGKPIDRIAVFARDRPLGDAIYGLKRPDIDRKYPEYRNTTGGFQFETVMPSADRVIHQVAVKVYSGGQEIGFYARALQP